MTNPSAQTMLELADWLAAFAGKTTHPAPVVTFDQLQSWESAVRAAAPPAEVRKAITEACSIMERHGYLPQANNLRKLFP